MSEANAERSTRQSENERAFNRDRYDAVLLDLDGVITDTASIHAACWKQMFDEYLQKRATQRGDVFRPFDIATDNRLYVDGKPRIDGARGFLTSRDIQLPEGSRDDPPQAETVGGLANRKDGLVNKIFEDVGVEPYAGGVGDHTVEVEQDGVVPIPVEGALVLGLPRRSLCICFAHNIVLP